MQNEFKAKEDCVVIFVPAKNRIDTYQFLVDAEDLPVIQSKAMWRMDKTNYSAFANFREDGKMKKITMQKLLTGWRHNDYADGDRFNLRRANIVKGKSKCHHEIGARLKGNKFFRVPGESVTFWSVDRNGKRNGQFITDEESFELVSKYTWTINKQTGYVQTRTRGGRDNSKGLYLHRLLSGAGEGQEVDHINMIKTDNRRSNLRICSCSQNAHNKPTCYGGKRRGVRWASTNRYAAYIQVNHKSLSKFFKTKEEAVAQREKWEKQYNPSGLR